MRVMPPILLLAAMMCAFQNAVADARSNAVIDCDKLRKGDPVACIACNVYWESRGQPEVGQLGVALVTKNRVESPLYPNNFCEVVWEKRRWRKGPKKNCWKDKRCGWSPQFSWTRDGKPDKVHNLDSWLRAVSYAERIVFAHNTGEAIHDITGGALWYHRVDEKPWVKHERDREHYLNWWRFSQSFHAPNWAVNYFPTVRLGDHQFYAKDEEAYLASLHSSFGHLLVESAPEAPEEAEASVTVENEQGEFDAYTIKKQ